MTADDATIQAVAKAIKHPKEQAYGYTDLAYSAIAALEELGWGKKPTRSELNDLLLSQYDQTAHSFSHSAVIRSIQQLLHAGYAVEDPEPEWEPTDEATDVLFKMWKDNPGTLIDYIPAVLKHLHDNPHLIGLEGE